MKQGLWLKVAAIPSEKAAGAGWDGSEHAQQAMSSDVPRPRFRGSFQWAADGYTYRADVHDQIKDRPISSGPLPPPGLTLPDAWWTALRTALDAIKAAATNRTAIKQERLHWALPRFLGVPVNTEVPEWSTIHADIQWSNLVGPDLCILDWERWGRGPAGYDEAALFISSLTAPAVAERVRHEFKHVLDTPAGHFSQLVVASEYLQGMERGNNLDLEAPLRTHVAKLLS
ncbi:hypothetical protein ACFU6R_00690 [Streptomyces sp. NPDC057499]|uniref:hypothetical protein n=1 Tax=Streptomyces sp. NPDC057499 TaxID=3346150 RepID=UPI00368525A6